MGVALLIGLAVYLRTGTTKAEPPTKTPSPTVREWTPDEMAADPEGYLTWADRQLETQVRSRESFLKTLAERSKAVEEKRKALLGNLDEIENFHKRLETAARRAEDEDRWPVQVGGRNFDRAKAKSVLEETKRYLEDRKPLAGDYEKAMLKMNEKSAAFRKEIADVGRLREKLSLDLERVRLKQAMPELDQLRRAEEEISYYAKLLGSMDEDEGASGGKTPVPPTIDLQTLLK